MEEIVEQKTEELSVPRKTPPTSGKAKKLRAKLARNSSYILMCMPIVIKTIIFSIFPMLWLVMAFQYYTAPPLFANEWADPIWYHFISVLDFPGLKEALINTVFLNILFIGLGTPITAVSALFMHEMKNRMLTKVFQTIWFIPYLISWSVAQYSTWGIMEDNGLINTMLMHLHIIKTPIDFYTSKNAWMWPGILMLWNIWKGQGYSVILDYAALQSLDTSIMEASELDGANRFQRMWYIEVPHLRKIVSIQLIMSMGGIVRSDFGLFYFLPQYPSGSVEEGIQNSTMVLDLLIYKFTKPDAFKLQGITPDYSKMTAIGILQSLVGMVLMLFTNWIVKKLDEDSAFI